jgi:hypothetical protein
MRPVFVCLAASLLLLTACQNKQEQAASATAPASAGTIADTSAVAESPAPAKPAVPGEPAMGPEIAPKIVMDTTPVDTKVLDVKLADKADGKMLTGLMTDQFKPSDGVFMSIHTDGTANKFTLSSKWLTPNGDTLTEYSQVITSAGPNDTIFSLSKPDGWAKGEYRVELSINGRLMKTVPFTVR